MKRLRWLLWKDLVAETRSHEIVIGSTMFALLLLFIFSFALPVKKAPAESVNAALWTVVFFASSLAFSRSFAKERDTGTLETLLQMPADRGTLFVAKCISNFVFVALVEIVTVPLFAVFYNFSFLPVLLPFAGLLAIVTVGLVISGTFMGALTAQAKGREVLLLLLLLPYALPLFMTATAATKNLLAGVGYGIAGAGVFVFLFFDVFLAIVLFALFELLMEE
ncbi:MAG: heme exporter protein CcmB [bacterium]